MAIAFVKQATQVAISASSLTALTITLASVVAGNALVPVASIYDFNTTWSITDITDGSSSYTTRSAFVDGAGPDRTRAVAGWAVNVAGGSMTASINLAGTSGAGNRYAELGLMEFSGVATSATEDAWDPNDSIAAGSDASAGPISTSDAGDLLIGVACSIGNKTNRNWGSPQLPSAWANRYRQNNEQVTIGFDAATLLPGATLSSYSAQWSHDNDTLGGTAAVIVALKPAGAAASVLVNIMSGRGGAAAQPL